MNKHPKTKIFKKTTIGMFFVLVAVISFAMLFYTNNIETASATITHATLEDEFCGQSFLIVAKRTGAGCCVSSCAPAVSDLCF